MPPTEPMIVRVKFNEEAEATLLMVAGQIEQYADQVEAYDKRNDEMAEKIGELVGRVRAVERVAEEHIEHGNPHAAVHHRLAQIERNLGTYSIGGMAERGKQLDGFIGDLVTGQEALAERANLHEGILERHLERDEAHPRLQARIADLEEQIAAVGRTEDEYDVTLRAVSDRMTALEKMLTGYVEGLNKLATVESVNHVLAKHLDRIDAIEGQVADVREGLPRDITAPIGAIIQGLSERLEALEARLVPLSPDNAAILFGRVNEIGARLDGLNLALDSVTSGGGAIGWRLTELEQAANDNRGAIVNISRGLDFTEKRLGLEVADLRASVKVLGEDITAVGDRLGNHLGVGEDGSEVAHGYEGDPGDETHTDRYGPIGDFDHDYLAKAVEHAVAEFSAELVKRIAQIARAADANEVPF